MRSMYTRTDTSDNKDVKGEVDVDKDTQWGITTGMHTTLCDVALFVSAENKALEAKRIFVKFDTDKK